jgi:diacylglycerol kinase family enzyme
VNGVLLIANSDAGGQDPSAIRAATTAIESHGLAVEPALTDDDLTLDAALDRRDGRDIVVAGGDGSLHKVVSSLARRGELGGPTVGLIPLGTGNDFARSTGIPLDPAAAGAVFATCPRTDIDLIADDEGGVVVNAVHLGVGADAARRASDWKPMLGRLAYLAGGLVAGLTARGVRVRVQADEKVLADGARRVLQVAVGNGRSVGGGTALLPRADPSDAQADVIVSFALPPWRRLRYAAQVRRAAHPFSDDVATARASVVRVQGEPFWCNVDGELTGPHSSRVWTVLPHAMTMALPAPA